MSDFDSKSTPNAGVGRQITTTAIVSISALVIGMRQGWTSPTTLKLMADDSPVGPMTKQEIANLAAIPSYFGLAIGLLLAYVANRFGRKPAMIYASIPFALGFLIMGFAENKVWLYVGKLLSWFTPGGLSGAQLYVGENVHQSIRGVLMSACTVQINVGILLAYVLGKMLNFQWFNISIAAITLVFIALMTYVPESPYFLVTRLRHEDAKKSLQWYRGDDINLAENELEIIKQSIQQGDKKEEVTLRQELKQRASKIAIFVGLTGFCLQTLSGIHLVINFAGLIFDEAKSPLSSDDSAIITALLNMTASIVNLFLIDRFGRRTLLMVSFVCGSISLTILTVHLYLVQNTGIDLSNFGWLPLACLGVFIFTYGLGLASVPGILQNELAPTKLRAPLGIMVDIAVVSLLVIMVQTFPLLTENVGLYISFVIPALCNIGGIFFTLFGVPETKGKSLAEISDELNRKSTKNLE